MKQTKEWKVIYLCVHNRLRERSQKGFIMRKEVRAILGKTYHIPKRLHEPVIKELKDMELLETINPRELKVMKEPIKLYHTSKIYRLLGLN